MHDATRKLLDHATAGSIDPARVKKETDDLLDLLEDLESAATKIERLADDVDVLAVTGEEDAAVVGRVSLYRSKAGALLREARAIREPLVRFRRVAVEFHRADRQIRATLKKAGHDVRSDDLDEETLRTAPDLSKR